MTRFLHTIRRACIRTGRFLCARLNDETWIGLMAATSVSHSPELWQVMSEEIETRRQAAAAKKAIRAVSWDEDSQMLAVHFTDGRVRQYPMTPAEVFRAVVLEDCPDTVLADYIAREAARCRATPDAVDTVAQS